MGTGGPCSSVQPQPSQPARTHSQGGVGSPDTPGVAWESGYKTDLSRGSPTEEAQLIQDDLLLKGAGRERPTARAVGFS